MYKMTKVIKNTKENAMSVSRRDEVTRKSPCTSTNSKTSNWQKHSDMVIINNRGAWKILAEK
jgi:hypothetical protein